MPPAKIMVIRHAEKPSDDGSIVGVTAQGSQDPEELVVRGWQRSGALVRFFAPPSAAFANPGLATPGTIFASAVGHHSNSLRPQHTVLELATVLSLQLVLQHKKGEEAALVADVLGRDGVVLIAWEHEAIPDIGNLILGNAATVPQIWPGDRFDLVWIFDFQAAAWRFTQVPQLLLSGDSPAPIQ
jgi:hypothetical protein